jgi:hypothetical protein
MLSENIIDFDWPNIMIGSYGDIQMGLLFYMFNISCSLLRDEKNKNIIWMW